MRALRLKKELDRLRSWALAPSSRWPHKGAAAVANKLARTAWVVWRTTRGTAHRPSRPRTEGSFHAPNCGYQPMAEQVGPRAMKPETRVAFEAFPCDWLSLVRISVVAQERSTHPRDGGRSSGGLPGRSGSVEGRCRPAYFDNVEALRPPAAVLGAAFGPSCAASQLFHRRDEGVALRRPRGSHQLRAFEFVCFLDGGVRMPSCGGP